MDVYAGSVKESRAKQKRQPFTVQNGEHAHNVYCCQHTDEIATFYCASCRKPYGEECVGDEKGEQSICIVCAEAHVRGEIETNNKKGSARRFVIGVFAVAAAILLAVNMFILVQNTPTSEVQAQPEVTAQISKLVVCRHRLEVLAQKAAVFQEAFQRVPDDIGELKNLLDEIKTMRDPVTNAQYIIGSDAKHPIKIICPTPEGHGLSALYAVPGKPAKMIYSNRL